MQQKRIAISADHAGFDMKEKLIAYLKSNDYAVVDLGCYNPETPVDYPDQAHKLARALFQHEADVGILTCGSGIGMSMAINRYPFIRGALVFNPEMARLSRFHNNANVLILGGRLMDEQQSIECLKTFLDTPFEGGRHEIRLQKLSELPRPL